MEAYVQTVSRKIPQGPDCGHCDQHNGKWCELFDEPYTGTKNVYCFRNKHIETVHQAWIGEGREVGK